MHRKVLKAEKISSWPIIIIQNHRIKNSRNNTHFSDIIFFHIFSLDDVSLYFNKFYLRWFEVKKVLNFYRLQNWKKPSVQGLNFSSLSSNWNLSPNWHFPELAPPQTSSFCKFFFVPLRIWVAQLPVHPSRKAYHPRCL